MQEAAAQVQAGASGVAGSLPNLGSAVVARAEVGTAGGGS